MHFVAIANELASRVPTEVVVPGYRGREAGWRFRNDVTVHSLSVPRKSWLALLAYELRKCTWLMGRRIRLGSAAVGDTVYLTRIGVLGLAVAVARVMGYEVVLEVNGWSPDEFRERGWPLWMRVGVRLMCDLQVSAATRLVCVTPGLARRAQRRGTPTLVLPNGADTSLYRAGAPAVAGNASAPDNVSVVFAGAVVAWQDLRTAIRALGADDARRWRLVVVGAGEDTENLQQLAREHGVAHRIDWEGWHPRERLPAILAKSDIGLVPLKPKGASDVCGSPLKLFEYLAAGLKVVATDVDGVTELAADLPIELYPIGDESGLNDAIMVASTAPALDGAELAAVRERIDWTERCTRLLNFVAAGPA